jgi:mono/diheme cytochrome c family protein
MVSAVLVASATSVAAAVAQTATTATVRTLEQGAYTAAQQQRGAAIYNRECSTCHGEMLEGGEGSPALVGPTFDASFNGQTVADLFGRIRETMPAPPEQPGKLTPQQYADVVAHILNRNKFPVGGVELSPDVELLTRLRITRAK